MKLLQGIAFTMFLMVSRTLTFAGTVDPCDADTNAPCLTVPADVTVACGDNTSPASTGLATGSENCDSLEQTYSVLHYFSGSPGDGSRPSYNDPIVVESNLFGMSPDGGSSNLGAIHKINTNGSGLTLLHSFTGGTNDGRRPHGSLALNGSTLYGMTVGGGKGTTGNTDTGGTIFKINTDGSDYVLLHNFTGTNGWRPHGSLTVSGSTLYGMTTFGGISNKGVVFRMDTSSTNYSILHHFTGKDGREPYGRVLVLDSNVYGLTISGGSNDSGVIFRMNDNGTNFTVLHHFAGGTNDGRSPNGSLILSGSTLYGTTYLGGSSNVGSIFKINTDGSGYEVLRYFTGQDGRNPDGTLTAVGSALYGMTPFGGNHNKGVIFHVNSDGNNYQLLHHFTGGGGAEPHGALTPGGETLYGSTTLGGSNNLGVIFAFTPSSSSTGNVSVTYGDADETGCGNSRVITRTWTATDACGNSTNGVQTITVIDTTAPTLNIPDDITVANGADIDPVATGSSPLQILASAFNQKNGHTYYLLENSNWTNAEAAAVALGGHLVTIDNAAEQAFVFNLWGDHRSLWIGLNDVANEGTFEWSSGTPVGYTHWEPGEPNGVNGPGEDYAYMFAHGFGLGDGAWNDIFNDTKPDIIQPPLYGVVEVNVAAAGVATATDACDSSPVVSYSDATNGTCYKVITRTWTAMDACGNSTNAEQTINVTDITPPTLSSIPPDITVECDVDTNLTSSLQILASVLNPTNGHTYYLLENSNWTDAEAAAVTLGGHLVTIDDASEQAFVFNLWGSGRSLWIGLNDAENEGTFAWSSGAPVGYTNWQPGEPNGANGAGDDYAYMLALGFGVGNGTWNDTFSSGLDPDQPPCYGVVEVDVAVTNSATATDDCDPSPLIGYSDEHGTSCPRVITRTWTATDSSGNSTSAVQTITAVDSTAPTLNIPPDTTLECGMVTNLPTTTLQIQASALNPNNGHIYYLLENSNWTNAEAAAVAIGGHLVTINDASEQAFIFNLWGHGRSLWIGISDKESEGTFVWSSGTPVGYTHWEPQEPNGVNGPGEDYAYMVAQGFGLGDGAWNDIFNDTKPDILQPHLYGVVEIENTVDNLATATDNCDTAPSVTYSDDAEGTCPEVITRTWTATDACGNSTNGIQTITLVDTTAPILNIPEDITVECNADTNLPLTSLQILDSTFNPTNGHMYYLLENSNWTDAEAAGVALGGHLVTINDAAEQAFIFNLWGHGRSLWIGINDASNESAFAWSSGTPVGYTHWEPHEPNGVNGPGEDYAYMVTFGLGLGNGAWNDIFDDTKPDIRQPPLYGVVEIKNAKPANATAADNCDPAPSLSYSDDTAGICPKVITRTWTVIDACGNSTNGIQTITVVDTTAPIMTLYGSDLLVVQIDTEFIDPGAEAVDGCDGDLTPSMATNGVVDTTSEGIYNLTYWAADVCGNTGEITRTVHVVNTTPTDLRVLPVYESNPIIFLGVITNEPCQVDASTNMIDWTSVGTVIPLPESPFLYQFVDPEAATHDVRFYRIHPP